jgi:hypothetical protein
MTPFQCSDGDILLRGVGVGGSKHIYTLAISRDHCRRRSSDWLSVDLCFLADRTQIRFPFFWMSGICCRAWGCHVLYAVRAYADFWRSMQCISIIHLFQLLIPSAVFKWDSTGVRPYRIPCTSELAQAGMGLVGRMVVCALTTAVFHNGWWRCPNQFLISFLLVNWSFFCLINIKSKYFVLF